MVYPEPHPTRPLAHSAATTFPQASRARYNNNNDKSIIEKNRNNEQKLPGALVHNKHFPHSLL